MGYIKVRSAEKEIKWDANMIKTYILMCSDSHCSSPFKELENKSALHWIHLCFNKKNRHNVVGLVWFVCFPSS